MTDSQRTWPQTVEQAVDRLLDELSATEKANIRDNPKSQLILHHLGLGMYIRNTFGIYAGNSALINACDSSGHGFIHPDDVSGVILEALWDRLNGHG